MGRAVERARPPSEHFMTPLSILELVRVTQETDARGALNNARDLAAHAEKLGYGRVWVAEHHNMAGIASAATSVVLGHIAEGTSTIRVGAGGIMLPNHAPYTIAEQFGTLARLFPGRIDLGLGRAPGTDQLTLHALRRPPEAADTFPQDVLDPWIGPFRRDAGRRIGAALCVRIAFRARSSDLRARGLPQSVQAVRATRPALRNGRRQHPCRQQRRQSAASRHHAADVIHQHLPWRARFKSAADRRHRKLLDADGEGASDADAGALHHRLTGFGS